MKILYLSNSTCPSRSANSLQVMKMCEAFVQNGHEVKLLTRKEAQKQETIKDDVFEFYNVSSKFDIVSVVNPLFLGKLFYALKVVQMIFQFKPDLVYSRVLHGCFWSVIMKQGVIFESHFPIFKEGLIQFWLIRFLLSNRFLKRLVVISEALKRMYIELGGLNDSKLLIARDGANRPTEELSARDMPGNSSLRVGYVGSFNRGKGVEIVVECAKKLADVDFHLAGGFPEQIRELKERHNLPNLFFHGHLKQIDVLSFQQACDILIAPYETRSFAVGDKMNISDVMSPIKIYEYIAAKRAVLTSDLPVLREFLNDEMALLVEPQNVDAWVAGLHKLRSPELREKLSNRAYAVSNDWTWHRRALRVLEGV